MRLLSALLLVLASAVSARAQSDSEVYVEQATEAIGMTADAVTGEARLGPVESLAASLANRNLTGETNVLVVTQSGTGNALTLNQIGQNNAVALLQTGDDNAYTLNQLGNSNVVLSAIDGSANEIQGVQQGDGNTYSLVLVGDATVHTIAQLGANNVAEQTVAPGLLPASIEQRGNGLEVYVDRN